MTSLFFSNADLTNATAVENGQKLQAEEDDKSSSLSELGERTGMEHSSRAGSEANDTEAETERLEGSPQKQKNHQDMVLISTDCTYGDTQNQSAAQAIPETVISPGQSSTENTPTEVADRASDLGSEGERLAQTSDISSLEDSSEESGKGLSPTSSTLMKRKRENFVEDRASDQDTRREPSTKTMKLSDSNAEEASAKLDTDVVSDDRAANQNLQVIADSAMSPRKEEQSWKPQALRKQKYKKGKRKGKRSPNDESANAENVGSGVEINIEHGGNAEVMDSNEEDAQIENMAEAVEAEDPAKMEERRRIHEPFWSKS